MSSSKGRDRHVIIRTMGQNSILAVYIYLYSIPVSRNASAEKPIPQLYLEILHRAIKQYSHRKHKKSVASAVRTTSRQQPQTDHQSTPLSPRVFCLSQFRKTNPQPDIQDSLDLKTPNTHPYLLSLHIYSTKMCHFTLSIHPCGDSYINRTSLCSNGAKCTIFEVVRTETNGFDCFQCRRSPKRRMLPAKSRGIFAPS